MADNVAIFTPPTGPGSTVRARQGGSGGGHVEIPLKDYIDAQDEKTRAQNDARFAEVNASISKVLDRVSSLKDPLSLWQLIVAGVSILGVGLGIVFGVLAYASDRFDGGIAASSLLDALEAQQAERDAGQDAKLDAILGEIRSLRAQEPPVSP